MPPPPPTAVNIDPSGLSVRGMLSSTTETSTPIRDRVSQNEWQARVDLAACYRLIDMYGMSDLVYNHITARLDDEPDHFLINAYGLHYSEITASSLHKIDHEGNIVDRGDSHYGINYAGFVIHSAVHGARPNVKSVIHTHTRAGIAVSAMKQGLLPISLQAMRFTNNIGYHDCEGSVVDLNERDRIIANLANHDAMILRNHGLLACGATIQEAFNIMYSLELACRVQVDVMAAGADVVFASQEAQMKTAHLFQRDVRRPYGIMEWDALLRLLDKSDPSYRE